MKARENLGSMEQRKYEKLNLKESKYVNDVIKGKLKVRRVHKAQEVLETANKLQSWNTEYIKIGEYTYRTADIIKALDQAVVNYYEITRHKSSVKKLLEKNITSDEMELIPELANILNEQNVEEQKVVTQTRRELTGIESNIEANLSSVKQEIDNFNISKTLKVGVDSKEVEKLQDILHKLGYAKMAGGGYYSNETAKEVKALQKDLKHLGLYRGSIDGKFGKGTLAALKSADLTKLHTSGTQDRFERAKIHSDHINHAERLKDSLKVVEKYLEAFNEAYGGKGDLFSKHNGILAIAGDIFGLREKDVDTLYNKLLKDKEFHTLLNKLGGNLNGKVFADKLGLNENSKKFEEGKRRVLIIFLVGLLTGNIAVEIAGINYGSIKKQGPKVEKILKSFGINIDIEKEFRDAMVDKKTTKKDINEIYDILNNEAMDYNTIKRYIDEIEQSGAFEDFFEALGNIVSAPIKLISKLFGNNKDNTNLTPEGQIKLALKNFKDSKDVRVGYELINSLIQAAYNLYQDKYIAYSNAYWDYETLKKMYEKRDPSAVISSHPKRNIADLPILKAELDKKYEEYLKARRGLSKMLGVIGPRYSALYFKYQLLDGKTYKDFAEEFQQAEIDFDNDAQSLRKKDKLRYINPNNLHSKQSFGPSININKLGNKAYMKKRVQEMLETTVNGKTSILATIARAIRYNYFAGADVFQAEDLVKAFENAKPVRGKELKKFKKYMMSNLGREKLQKFQGDWGKGNIFKIEIHGVPIYFKDKCTNLLTYATVIDTTVEYKKSMPLLFVKSLHSGAKNTVDKSNGTGHTKTTTEKVGEVDPNKLGGELLDNSTITTSKVGNGVVDQSGLIKLLSGGAK